jgi:hypothetical protein
MEDCALDQDLHNSTALIPLTGLVSLGLNARGVMLSLLPRLNLEQLQGLTLLGLCGDVRLLNRASGLTSLQR